MSKNTEKGVSATPKTTLISRLDYPVVIQYGDDNVMIPPKGTLRNLVTTMIGDYPNGIIAREETE